MPAAADVTLFKVWLCPDTVDENPGPLHEYVIVPLGVPFGVTLIVTLLPTQTGLAGVKVMSLRVTAGLFTANAFSFVAVTVHVPKVAVAVTL